MNSYKPLFATRPNRRQASVVSLDVSADVLSNPKWKLSRAKRRDLLRSRDFICLDPHYAGAEARNGSVKLALKLQSLPLIKVQSFARRFARRASTAAHLARKLSENSPFRAGIEARIVSNTAACNQAFAELDARRNHAAK